MLYIGIFTFCNINKRNINPNLFFLQNELSGDILKNLENDINNFLIKYNLQNDNFDTGDKVLNLISFLKNKKVKLTVDQYSEFRSILVNDMKLEDVKKCCIFLNKLLLKILDKKVEIQNICLYYALYINIFNYLVQNNTNYETFMDLSIECKVWEKLIKTIYSISSKKADDKATNDEIQMLDNILWFGMCAVFGTDNYYDILFKHRNQLFSNEKKEILPFGQLVILILRCVTVVNLSDVQITPIDNAIQKYTELNDQQKDESIQNYVNYLNKLKNDLIRSKGTIDE